MRRRRKTPIEIDLTDPQYYFNRELSWIEFNSRVLHEAFDPRTPLIERLKFLAIFSSNLDEYFMVRVAALKQQVEAEVRKLSADGKTPQEQLAMIRQRLHPLVTKQHRHFEQALRPQLAGHGIFLLDYMDLNQEQRAYLKNYFEEQVFPVLTPLAIDPSHPFPYISNLSLNLAVVIKDSETGEELYARVKAPKVLPRFIQLPIETNVPTGTKSKPTLWAGVPLEQVIAHNLESLFPGMQIQEYYPFRVTRNADLEVEEDEADDLMLAIEQELRKRRVGGSVVRLETPSAMPTALRSLLMEEMDVVPEDVYEIDGLLSLRDLMNFLALPVPDLKDAAWKSVVHPRLRRVVDSDVTDPPSSKEEDFFAVVRKQDLLVHHPYHSFTSSVQRFIEEAAHDPDVLAIKMTLYRTSGDSPIIQALITAAENGKQVAVLVELKARFDEENNILWAKKLESSGVHVVYGLVGLKTHTKLVLVVRREAGRIRRYAHVGTGNYNPKTASLYTDLGLFSCREDIGADLTDLFNYLTGYSRQRDYRKLVVAPVNLRDRILTLIQREIDHQRAGNQGRIVAKMNALVDPQIIRALYEASQAGVSIDLIIRGICCLKPGLAGVSENIRVISIIGRFLEHSRIFYFRNNGEEEILIGSADWMPRNLDRRVEAVVPVEDPELILDLQEMLGVMLADNRQAWELQADGRYVQRRPSHGSHEQPSQKLFCEMAQQANS
ncbi:polyphosphate kinase 1 [Alkalinema sp. FACHB-956]|uniref:polyphosphate kinase 1 n=1 Tax=Alkalinema sp. FACHB-956 TaxID=2692768 RepID=UPI0016838984|nr:polyphosphate kinase 1 [Alkalinema sp. FACHB-956]MBD2327808.1 polyphosphate kinase 1 [Alkalinema sp. FACHB-956]